MSAAPAAAAAADAGGCVLARPRPLSPSCRLAAAPAAIRGLHAPSAAAAAAERRGARLCRPHPKRRARGPGRDARARGQRPAARLVLRRLGRGFGGGGEPAAGLCGSQGGGRPGQPAQPRVLHDSPAVGQRGRPRARGRGATWPARPCPCPCRGCWWWSCHGHDRRGGAPSPAGQRRRDRSSSGIRPPPDPHQVPVCGCGSRRRGAGPGPRPGPDEERLVPPPVERGPRGPCLAARRQQPGPLPGFLGCARKPAILLCSSSLPEECCTRCTPQPPAGGQPRPRRWRRRSRGAGGPARVARARAQVAADRGDASHQPGGQRGLTEGERLAAARRCCVREWQGTARERGGEEDSNAGLKGSAGGWVQYVVQALCRHRPSRALMVACHVHAAPRYT